MDDNPQQQWMISPNTTNPIKLSLLQPLEFNESARWKWPVPKTCSWAVSMTIKYPPVGGGGQVIRLFWNSNIVERNKQCSATSKYKIFMMNSFSLWLYIFVKTDSSGQEITPIFPTSKEIYLNVFTILKVLFQMNPKITFLNFQKY